MTKTAREKAQDEQELKRMLHDTIQAFMVDYSMLDCPRSWRKSQQSDQARDWRKSDDVEMKRMQDFNAYAPGAPPLRLCGDVSAGSSAKPAREPP